MLLQQLTFLKGRYSFMKKVLSVLLAVALCFSVFSVAVFAEGEDIQLKLNASANAKMGDTITVTVSLESNKGYAGLKYDLGFDSTQLSLVTAKFEGDFAGDGSAAGMLGMFSDDKTRAASLVLPADKSDAGETTKTGTLATYTFKVLANGTKDAATNVNITLTVKDAFDKDLNSRSVNGFKRKLDFVDNVLRSNDAEHGRFDRVACFVVIVPAGGFNERLQNDIVLGFDIHANDNGRERADNGGSRRNLPA